ncbi:MAG: multiheme c-type cytochrome [Candidatus Poribacteria bacterium]
MEKIIIKKWIIAISSILVISIFAFIAFGKINKVTAVPANAKYVSEKKCYMCHKAIAKTHEKSKHALSFKCLVDNNQDQNPKCLQCHTTGYGKPGGFADINATSDLAGVGCQACHGPGSDHIENGLTKEQRKERIYIDANNECTKCHKIHQKHIEVKSK